MSRLFDTKPAAKWEEAYPLGNGRIGAMVFGQPGYERIQLNEDSVWYGEPVDRINPETKKSLPEVRELIRQGKIPEAEKRVMQSFSGIPQSQRPYQSAGDLWINWEGSMDAEAGYERELDLERAVASSISRGAYGETKRHYFVSAPDQVMVIHADAPGEQTLSLSALLTRGRFYETVKKVSDDTVMLLASCGEGGVRLAVAVKAVADGGEVQVAGEHLLVKAAKSVTLYVAAETTFYCGEDGTLPKYPEENGENSLIAVRAMLRLQEEQLQYVRRAVKRLDAAAEKGYEQILRDHETDYRSLFGRVRFRLAGQDTERLEYTRTYFDYGRYLLISCSRPGSLPANLQGIWNEEMQPCWDSKFTININTEMNYWPAEVCDLPECHRPLFDLLKRMRRRGRETARRMYGCRGMTAHHNTDIWADCAPQDICISATYWVMGAAWLCTHIRNHYEHTGDEAFLKEMYPVLKDAAVFFHDFLTEDQGELVTSPSISPENTYIMENGVMGCLCAGPSMDTQIVRDLLENYANVSQLLGIEDEDTGKNREILGRLPQTKIGKHGQIMEWREDYEEKEPGHRHISQLYALHPSGRITRDGTPELAQAAANTLARRLTYGGGHTGWSCAWIVNLYARLGDGDAALENLKKLYEKSTFPNMMDNHPMFDYFVFQIDGNFGATAGITEMILQSSPERTILLPALPGDWEEGEIEGLVLCGGAKADIYWRESKLKLCRIRARRAIRTRICYLDQQCEIDLPEDGRCVLKMTEGGLVCESV